MASVIALLVGLFAVSVLAMPEQGKWIVNLDQDHMYAAVSKHMYKGSRVTASVSLKCGGEKSESVEIDWLLRMSPCGMEFWSVTEEINSNDPEKLSQVDQFMKDPIFAYSTLYETVEWKQGSSTHNCSRENFKLEGSKDQKPVVHVVPKPPVVPEDTTRGQSEASYSGSKERASTEKKSSDSQQKSPDAPPAASADQDKAGGEGETQPPTDSSGKHRGRSDTFDTSGSQGPSVTASRKKREEPQSQLSAQATAETSITAAPSPGDELDYPDVGSVWVDGNYLFVIRLRPKSPHTTFHAEVTIRMFYGDENFISAMDYPLLIFHGIMGLVYIIYSLVWLVLLACNWQDLLRVHFLIGGVILLGMLENAVFFAEYMNINKTGQSVQGALIFTVLVSSLKGAVARMLVIILSLGFGIVRPQLGQAFYKVLIVGGLYFILISIGECLLITNPKTDLFLFAAVPMLVLHITICTWIFLSLIKTTRTLRRLHNVVKRTLYQHFTITLILYALAIVAAVVWSITQHKFKECIKDWKLLWVDWAFLHMLFALLLFIIMLLWRPTASNLRSVFSPLLDVVDEENDK